LKGLVHLLDALHHQRFLNGEKSRDDVVIHLYNEIKTTGPSPVGVNLGEQITGAIRHRDVKDLEIFDLTKIPDKNRIKVDSDETLFSKLCFLAHEKELVELIFSIFFDTTLPFVDLVHVELVEVFTEGVVEFHNVLVLFAILK
jgi:hypothetical protein